MSNSSKKKLWIFVNLINFLTSLLVTVLYVYPKSKDVFISIFFYLGIVYFFKLLIEQIAKQWRTN